MQTSNRDKHVAHSARHRDLFSLYTSLFPPAYMYFGSSLYPPVSIMDPDCIPDDIWICIFEHLTDPAQLAVLIRTCRRFNNLASKLLLHELRWGKSESTTRNLGAWSGGYRDFVALPRKLTLGVAFDSGTFMRGKWHNVRSHSNSFVFSKLTLSCKRTDDPGDASPRPNPCPNSFVHVPKGATSRWVSCHTLYVQDSRVNGNFARSANQQLHIPSYSSSLRRTCS